MIDKTLDTINEEDLNQLIENAVIEKKTIEYKSILPQNSDGSKKEFLADVSSFANSSGGDIIYGIEEDRENGLPKEVKGIEIKNVDQEILRIDQIIRSGIEPRLPSYEIKSISLSNKNKVIIIRIQRSWIGPHRVSFKGTNKFHARSTNGKYEMDVDELRQSFNLTETTIDKIRWHRKDRISYIDTPEFNVNFENRTKLVLHLISFDSFKPGVNVPLSILINNKDKIHLRPIYCSSYNIEYNFDGVISYNEREGKIRSFVQVYRNGIIEAVSGNLINPSGSGYIPSVLFEKELITSLSEYLEILKHLGVGMPIVLMLSMLNVNDLKMGVGSALRFFESHPIDRKELLLNEVKIDKYDEDPSKILHRTFDTIWNSCGYIKSHNYDDDGKWIGHE